MMRKVVLMCVSAAVLAVLPLAVGGDKPNEATIYGTVRCSAAAPVVKGATTTPSDSVQDCLDRHGLIVIVEDGKDHGTAIDNPNVVRGYEGRRVSVSGYRKGDSFHVVSMRII